jgi:hypothetical protein
MSFFLRMYLLNIEPLTSLGCPLNVVSRVLGHGQATEVEANPCLHGTVPQDAGTPFLWLLQILNLSIISIAVLENVSPTQGNIKEPPIPH